YTPGRSCIVSLKWSLLPSIESPKIPCRPLPPGPGNTPGTGAFPAAGTALSPAPKSGLPSSAHRGGCRRAAFPAVPPPPSHSPVHSPRPAVPGSLWRSPPPAAFHTAPAVRRPRYRRPRPDNCRIPRSGSLRSPQPPLPPGSHTAWPAGPDRRPAPPSPPPPGRRPLHPGSDSAPAFRRLPLLFQRRPVVGQRV
ncbi:Morphogenetic protein safA, partial [Dysosmobacter welbionis]